MFSSRAARIEKFRRKAQTHLLFAMLWYWWMPPTKPFCIGRHTRAICSRLDRAVDDFMIGKSTFLIVTLPFRHGKSDIVSRALPPYFLGRCKDFHPDIIMSGYGTSLVKGFSRKAQGIIESDAYRQLFPGVEIDPDRSAAEEWGVKGSQGTIVAQGLGGSITGKGGNLIIVDDYCKNREEAESDALRDKLWDSFKDDLMTRTNAPAAIVIVCATRWHKDDLIGRIYDAMKKDPDFPRFETLKFPARLPGQYNVLFPELYSPEWYSRQRATLGNYSAAALLDCEPIGSGMTTFKSEWWCEYGEGFAPALSDMNVYIEVDPANSKGVSADWTTMFVKGKATDGNTYVLDIVHDHLNLLERTQVLFALVKKWHPMRVFYESYGLDSDIQHIEDAMNRTKFHFRITRLKHMMPKVDRIKRLVPGFERGEYWFPNKLMKRRVADGTVYDAIMEFREEYDSFPMVKHDDMIDAFSDDCDTEVLSQVPYPKTEQNAELEARRRAQRLGGLTRRGEVVFDD